VDIENSVVSLDDEKILSLAGQLFGFSLGADFEGSMITEISPSLQTSDEREFLAAEILLADGRKITREILDFPLRVR